MSADIRRVTNYLKAHPVIPKRGGRRSALHELGVLISSHEFWRKNKHLFAFGTGSSTKCWHPMIKERAEETTQQMTRLRDLNTISFLSGQGQDITDFTKRMAKKVGYPIRVKLAKDPDEARIFFLNGDFTQRQYDRCVIQISRKFGTYIPRYTRRVLEF